MIECFPGVHKALGSVPAPQKKKKKVAKDRTPRIQSTEFKKLNKLKGPSENDSILFGREKKPISVLRDGERERPRWEQG